MVWHTHSETQRALRAIVLPRPGTDITDCAWQVLLQHRLHGFGLSDTAPDTRHLAKAEHELLVRLASPWTKLMTGACE
ncbi:hypothetical protein [Pseudodonghicola xiamenensis]|nr:hypothetical protein [Pseudodonghicola xiamenensis]